MHVQTSSARGLWAVESVELRHPLGAKIDKFGVLATTLRGDVVQRIALNPPPDAPLRLVLCARGLGIWTSRCHARQT